MMSHEAVIMLRLVILIKFIKLDKIYQTLCVCRISCISGTLQSMCPSTIITPVQTKQTSITWTITKEFAVVFITLQCTVVCTETLSYRIIIMSNRTSFPTMTLDTKVIITLTDKPSTTSSALQQTLCQGDAGRHAILQHTLNSHVLVLVNISLIDLIPFCRTSRYG